MPTSDAATDLAPPKVQRAKPNRLDPPRQSSTRGEPERDTRRPASVGGSAKRLEPSWLLPLAFWLSATAFTNVQVDPTEVAEGRFLALLGAGVLAAIVALELRGSKRSLQISATVCLGVLGGLWVLHHGAHRGAVVICILGAGLATALAAAERTRGAHPSVTVPAALGLQLLIRPDLLLPPLVEPRTVVSVVVLPTVVGLAVAALATRFGTARALLAAGCTVMLAPGWNVFVTSTWIVVAIASRILDLQSLRWRRLLPIVGGVLAIAGFQVVGDLQGATAGVLIAALALPSKPGASRAWTSRAVAGLLASVVALATYPWCRTDPLLSIAEAIGDPTPWLLGLAATVGCLWIADRGAADRQRQVVAGLTLAGLTLAWAGAAALLLPRPLEVSFVGPPPRVLAQKPMEISTTPATRRLTIDTDLVHGDQLASGAVVARVFLVGADGVGKGRWPIRAGRHTADWAAGRSDLAHRQSPDPWVVRVAPSGEFFGQRYRFEVELADPPAPGDRWVVRRAPRLDSRIQVRIHRVEVHR